MLMLQGQLDRALEVLQQARKDMDTRKAAEDDLALVHLNLGLVHAMRAELDPAEQHLRQSAELLKAQEEKIAKFKLQHLGELPQQSSANMSALTGLHSQLSTVESAIQQAQERQKLQDRAARISAVAFDKRPAFVQASRLASAAQAIKARVEGGMKLGDVLDSLDATERAAVDWLADQLTAARTN